MSEFVATVICDPLYPVLPPKTSQNFCDFFGVSSSSIRYLHPDVAFDIFLSSLPSSDLLSDLDSEFSDLPYDIIVQPVSGRRKRALISDMDSTMITEESIDELAREAGVSAEVSLITSRAMSGEIDFESALDERVSLLRGLRLSVIESVLSRLTYTFGARKLVGTMREHGAYCLLVSGGFVQFASYVSDYLGFNDYRANVLESSDDILVGTVKKPILDRDAKSLAVDDILKNENISPLDILSVGDGANDLGMLTKTTGVAFHAKPVVSREAPYRIEHCDLTGLLYMQGYTSDEFVSFLPDTRFY